MALLMRAWSCGVAGGFADVGSDDLASAVDNARPEDPAQCKKPKWCGPLGLALMAERATARTRIQSNPERYAEMLEVRVSTSFHAIFSLSYIQSHFKKSSAIQL